MLYIDDNLAGHKLFGAAVWLRNAQMLELEKLGFSLSAKGELLPFRQQRFLGMLVHLASQIPTWHLPEDKLQALLKVATELQAAGQVGEVDCYLAARCVGKLVSASRAVPIAKMMFREINAAIYSKGSPVWKGKMELTAAAKADLKWILSQFAKLNELGSPIWIDSVIEKVDYALVQDAGPRAVGLALQKLDKVWTAQTGHLPSNEKGLIGEGHMPQFSQSVCTRAKGVTESRAAERQAEADALE